MAENTVMPTRNLIFHKIQSRFFYGWAVLAIATVAMFASGPGQSHTFSVFVPLIARDLGISTTSVASSYAFATLIAAFGLTRMGYFVDRYGARTVMMVVTIVLGFASMAFGAATGVLTLSLGFMVMRFFGQGSMMLGATNLVAQWFNRKRGLAMSILMLGFSASMAFHPALSQWLIEQVGWRQAWVWIGVMTWVLMLPLLWLLAHEKPEPLGLRPDGAAPANGGEGDGTDEELTGLTLAAALRTPNFYIIGASLFSTAMLVTTLFFFQVSIFESQGLTASLAANMFSVSALAMAIFMPLVGKVLDRSDAKYSFAATLLLMSVLLVGVTFVTDLTSAVVYAVLFGILTAANMTFFGYMWAHYFGRKHLGSIQGVGQTIGVIGASLGPLPPGISFDYFGSYNGALYLSAVLPAVCAVAALFLSRPDHGPEQIGK